MKPEYEAYRKELLEKALSYYSDKNVDESIVLRGRCYSWTSKFIEKFPHLKQIAGFYGNNAEHYWCVDIDGSIVDPTIGQFYESEPDISKYRVFDETKDKIYLGKCMNCGWEIYGLKAEGPQSVCRPGENDEEQDCEAELRSYYN